MRAIIVAACWLAIAGASPATVLAEGDAVSLAFEVFRIRGEISGDDDLGHDFTPGAAPLAPAKSQPDSAVAAESPTGAQSSKTEQKPLRVGPTVFVDADLALAGVNLKAREGGWTWDGAANPPIGQSIEALANLRVSQSLGESFEIAIVSKKPVEYFQKRPDGLFEHKVLDHGAGMTISGTPDGQEPEDIMLRNLTIDVRTVSKRQPIEGVGLDVGLPVICST